MPNRRSSSSLVIGVLMIGAVGLVGWMAYVNLNPTPDLPEPEPGKVDPLTPDPIEEPEGVTLFVPTFGNGELGFETSEGTVPPGTDAHVYAINMYLRTLDAVPAAAEAVSCTIEDGVATLDFNDEFRVTYGTEDEMILYIGILRLMGQFDEVESVRFLATGEPIDTLGNQDLTGSHPVVR